MKPVREHLNYKCLSCNRIYNAIGPLSYIEPAGGISMGICSENCLNGYMRRYHVPTKMVAHEDILGLKFLGHHEFADWLTTGGLDDILKDEE